MIGVIMIQSTGILDFVTQYSQYIIGGIIAIIVLIICCALHKKLTSD